MQGSSLNPRGKPPGARPRAAGSGLAASGAAEGLRAAPIRILIADDDALVRRALTLLFEAADGVEVVGEAADGLDAVELTNQLRPDVVLMDYSMPRLNGIEATRQIMALEGHARVVGLSIFEHEIGDELCEAGAVTYVTKDCGPAVLLEAVRFAAEHPLRKPR